MSDTLKKETTETVVKPDSISSLFEERDRPPLQDDASSKIQKQAAPSLSSPQSNEEKYGAEAAKADDSTFAKASADRAKASADRQDTTTPDLKALQEELEKSRKAIIDTQKYGHQNARKLKSALKQTRALVEIGTLSEEEAMSLLESLSNSDDEETPEREASTQSAHPFAKVLNIANAELANLRKYSEDPLLDDKVKAFDYFLSVASKEDIEEALEELTELIDDPLNLTKRVLGIGKHYYDESYKDIAAAGGFQGFVTKKQKEIGELNRTIDKLTKKLALYEDFDKPRQRLDEVGESDSSTANKKGSVDLLLERRDNVKRR